MKFEQAELNSIDYDIQAGTIIKGTEYEYKIANDPWRDVGVGTEITFKPGSLQFRKKKVMIKIYPLKLGRKL